MNPLKSWSCSAQVPAQSDCSVHIQSCGEWLSESHNPPTDFLTFEEKHIMHNRAQNEKCKMAQYHVSNRQDKQNAGLAGKETEGLRLKTLIVNMVLIALRFGRSVLVVCSPSQLTIT
ncbi:hypothetical protein F2P81_010035 [Scophthalmus maximus]|uniref:Uncharacterized protein n=1 Tax=Scophthalmus maximus TaxID=52904 RepID=A0A6A4T1Q1_SCOMX|nr:hypothetical protein F2P81_010035 [Scophthalmus maximus]